MPRPIDPPDLSTIDDTAVTVVDAATFEQEAAQRPAPRIPTLGRAVQVLVDPALNNGADVAPAVVVRVWSVGPESSTVNLRCFLDSATAQGAEWATSRYLWPDEATARAQQDSTPSGCVSVHAFWPTLG